ncbi:MAG TPA: RnfABCDGE type electron transport complex subunit C [Alkalispirochaeta sp.]|nr:RnfABCDGE type electron transport complex subunit C [Alkalispirochaeta sp.]
MIPFFSGGVTPLPTEKPLEQGFWNAAVPTMCVVPLQQHAGSRLRSLVKPGEQVREGMVVAESGLRLSVPLHAPIPGRVTAAGTTTLLDGTRSSALSIQLDGEFDRLGKTLQSYPWQDLSPREILELIRSAGIVCGPRSWVPAHTYLRRRPTGGPAIVMLDVAETEPYLSAGAEIAAERPQEVLEGISIAAQVLNTDQIHVVVAGGFSRAYAALRSAHGAHVRVHRVPHRYPANTEYHMRRVAGLKRGKDDETDVVALSPATAAAIRDAVVFRKPQIDQVIAVGGGAVVRPAHIRVRIGTSIAEVLQECGGLTGEPQRIVAGGILTGHHVHNVNAPITKNVAAVIALTPDEVLSGGEEPCISCGGCVRACPVSINPSLLNDLVRDGADSELEAAGVFDCTECGLCAHVCPSRIPLVERIRTGKARLGGRS